jgi:hypothetical protein
VKQGPHYGQKSPHQTQKRIAMKLLVCFRSKANPKVRRALDSCSVLAQLILELTQSFRLTVVNLISSQVAGAEFN